MVIGIPVIIRCVARRVGGLVMAPPMLKLSVVTKPSGLVIKVVATPGSRGRKAPPASPETSVVTAPSGDWMTNRLPEYVKLVRSPSGLIHASRL